MISNAMNSYLVILFVLVNTASAGPQAGGSSSLHTSQPSETWTYYSTVVTSITVATKTLTVPGIEVKSFTVTDSRTVTEVTTSYDATVAGTTSGVPYLLTTTYVDPPPNNSSLSKVSVPSPSGFTPILSAFPYTASVKVITTTTTETIATDSVVYVDDPTSTETHYYTITEGYVVETQTVSMAGTLTLLNSTSYVITAAIATSTATRTPLPTHHAICDEDSGNYVNHFPFGAGFGDMVFGDNGDSAGYTTVHSLDAYGVYYNETPTVGNKVDCCNYAMSDPLTAFGYWEPQLYYGYQENVCYIFKVKDQGSCQPSEVKYTLLFSEDKNATGFYAFNGPCGRVTPDHHGSYYYQYGGQYSPENSP